MAAGTGSNSNMILNWINGRKRMDERNMKQEFGHDLTKIVVNILNNDKIGHRHMFHLSTEQFIQ